MAQLEQQAENFVEALLTPPAATVTGRRGGDRAAIDTFGRDAQKAAAAQAELLKEPIRALSHRADEGGEVASALLVLKSQIQMLDPGSVRLEPGLLARSFGWLPWIKTPVQRYFKRFQSSQEHLAATIKSLQLGRDTLRRDNITLEEDQKGLANVIDALQQAVAVGKEIDRRLEERILREIPESDPRHAFLRNDALLGLRQRVVDLQQQLAVSQQGLLAMDIIIKNNAELIRGVDRALHVTVSALQVAVTAALALARQKLVLDKVQSIAAAATGMAAGTAATLRAQGAQLAAGSERAAATLADLKAAFADVDAAMAQIDGFRQKALPQMADAILEMDRLTSGATTAPRG
jgi:uncharacterized protein YaaN involved in tellurite resistance